MTHLVALRVDVHGARSELDGLVFEDVTETEPSDLKRRINDQLTTHSFSFKA